MAAQKYHAEQQNFMPNSNATNVGGEVRNALSTENAASARLSDESTFNTDDPENTDPDRQRVSLKYIIEHAWDDSFQFIVTCVSANSTARVHYVLVDRFGTHICSCMRLVRYGLPCRHYFAVMLRHRSIGFHLTICNPRCVVSVCVQIVLTR